MNIYKYYFMIPILIFECYVFLGISHNIDYMISCTGFEKLSKHKIKLFSISIQCIREYIFNLFSNRNIFGKILGICILILSIPAFVFIIICTLILYIIIFCYMIYLLGYK